MYLIIIYITNRGFAPFCHCEGHEVARGKVTPSVIARATKWLVAISGPWGAVEWAFQKYGKREIASSGLPSFLAMTNIGEQPSMRKPRNEIASSCLAVLLAMTKRRGTPRNDTLPFCHCEGHDSAPKQSPGVGSQLIGNSNSTQFVLLGATKIS